MTEPDAQKRPADLHVLANRFQWAQAMPESDAQGTALLERMRAWAHQKEPMWPNHSKSTQSLHIFPQ